MSGSEFDFGSGKAPMVVSSYVGDENMNYCAICTESESETYYDAPAPCSHRFCVPCVYQWIKGEAEYGRPGLCPVCRRPLDVEAIQRMHQDLKVIRIPESTGPFGSSGFASSPITMRHDEFLALRGVDINDENMAVLEMIPSEQWTEYLKDVLEISPLFSDPDSMFGFDPDPMAGYDPETRHLYVSNTQGPAEKIIFKFFGKKIHINDNFLLIELSEHDQKILNSMGLTVARAINSMNKPYSHHHPAPISVQGFNGHGSITRTTETKIQSKSVFETKSDQTHINTFEIKLSTSTYDAYLGNESLNLSEFPGTVTKGNVSFHIIIQNSFNPMCYADAVEINLITAPTKE